MNNSIGAGLVLGVLVVIWTAVVIAAGWHLDARTMWLFFMVIPIQILVMVLALRMHAHTASYGRQVWNGFALSLMAAVVVFAGSYVLTTMVFPEYFPQIRAAAENMLQQLGRQPAEIAEEMQRNRSLYDPLANAMSGAVGTVLTGLVLSLILAAFMHRRHRPVDRHAAHP